MSPLTTLYVTRVSYYGRVTIKPQCDTSRLFAALLKQNTLTATNVEAIKALGYRVMIKYEEL